VVICFSNNVRSQRAEQFKNVQDLALNFATRVGCVIQACQNLQAPIHDKLRHARIVHATEPVLKTSKVVQGAKNNAGKRRIAKGWVDQVQDNVSPKFLGLHTI
jgi:hypothetical protein